MKKPPLALSLALGLAALGAQAATVSYQFGFPNPPLSNTEITVSGALRLFDINTGTLTDVSLTINSAMQGTITLSLGAATGNQNVRGISSSDLLFTSSLAPLNAALGAVTHNLSFTTGFINLAPFTSTTVQNLADTETTPLNAALDAFIASFGAAGGGNFNLGCTSLSGFVLTGGGGFAGTSETRQAGCGAQITYTFDPVRPPVVPEPGTIALVGLALTAAGVASRRRKA